MNNEGYKPLPENDNEKIESEGISRRHFLAGLGVAALSAGTAGSLLGENIIGNEGRLSAEDRDRLQAMRESIPTDIPVNVVGFDAEGRFVFQHENQETTEMVNFLAGIGPVREELLGRNLRKAMFALMVQSGIDMSAPENRDRLYRTNSPADIVLMYEDFYDVVPEERKENFHSSFDYALARIEEERALDVSIREQIKPELHQALWKIFIESGAPRIELVDSYAERTKNRDFIYGDSDRFLYQGDSGKPVVYIDSAYKSDKMLDRLLQELAHSYSYYTDRDGFLKRIKEKQESLNSSPDLSQEERRVENRKFYREEGHEEYYAHQIIYPQFVERLAPYHPTIAEYGRESFESLQKP